MGIVDFRERMLPQYERRFEALALSQAPDELFVTCWDSRVVPDLLASTEPGDLFTMRNVGNLIPPATAEGLSIGDLSEASAIEYAVLILKVRNTVVCRHSECGAMKRCWLATDVRRRPILRNGCITRMAQRFVWSRRARLTRRSNCMTNSLNSTRLCSLST